MGGQAAMKRFVGFIILLSGLLGCVRELPELPAPDPIAEEARVTVTMTIPAVTLSPDTKSLGEEIELNSLRLAIFGSSGYLKEYVSAKNLQKVQDVSYDNPLNPGEVLTAPCFTFMVSLPLSDSKRTIHFIGNGPSTLPFGAADEVLPKLMTYLNPESAEDQIQGFWQMMELEGGIAAKKAIIDGREVYVDQEGKEITAEGLRNGTQHYQVANETQSCFQNIQLVRNWSRIKVTAADDSNFELISYALYNAPSRGAIVPYNSRKGIFMENYQAKTFQMLEEEEYPANLPVGAELTKPEFIPENFKLDADGEFIISDSQGRVVKASDEKASVFLYERPIPSDRIPPTFVIVYGHFTDPDAEPGQTGQSGDYFYKVDLYEVNREEGISRYFPVYRNFQYEIIISKILSPGQPNPAAAAASAGNADVSADVTTSHLLDISDGRGRLVVSPWISHTFTAPVTQNSDFSTILQAKFFKPNGNDQELDLSHGAVTVQKLPMQDGTPDLIETCEIGDPDLSEDPNKKGWRTITFTTTTDSEFRQASRSQTIRVSGTYKDGEGEGAMAVTLYRDVVITVQPYQTLHVSVESDELDANGALPREVGKNLTLHVDIPEGLVESMFPLEFKIEPEDMTLTPVDTDLPVFSGKTISLHEEFEGKPAFYFVRTLTYEQYRGLERWTDDDDAAWRRFSCRFTTTKTESATTIWVQNSQFFKYDDKCQASFSNPLPNVFGNLAITDYIKQGTGVEIPIHFLVSKNPSLPEVKVTVTGMVLPDATISALGMAVSTDANGATVYTYQTKTRAQNLVFTTTHSEGDANVTFRVESVVPTMSGQEYYTPKTISSHRFSHIGFIDGHAIPNNDHLNGGVSNVVRGYCPKNGKNVLFGYCDEGDDDNPDAYAQVSFAGLSHLTVQKVSTPWKPASSDNETGFHLVHFKTNDDSGAISFTLRAPGYVESDPIVAGRMTGTDIHNWDGSTTSFVSSDFKTTVLSKSKGVYKVSFDKISKIESGCIVLSATDAGAEGFELKVEGTDANAGKVFYVEITVDASSDLITGQFSDQTQVWNPATTQVRARNTALFEKYKGAANEYVWFMPIPNGGYNTIKLKAQNGGDIKIKKIIPKSYTAGFTEPSTN